MQWHQVMATVHVHFVTGNLGGKMKSCTHDEFAEQSTAPRLQSVRSSGDTVSSSLVEYGCTVLTLVGVATDNMRPAITAYSSIGRDSWQAARTCWVVAGRRDTNNSRKSFSSMWCSPMSRCSLRRNCMAWLWPRSSSESNSRTRFCSKICVH